MNAFGRAGFAGFALLAGAFPAFASPAFVDSTVNEGLPIRRVVIRPRDVFEPVPDGRLAPVFRLGNRLHVTTRPATIRQQLLFDEGRPFLRADLLESERLLRRLDYLQPVRLAATRAGDSVDVEVVTQDAWTSQFQVNLERGGGKLYGSLGVTERNLFGFGKAADVSYDETPSGITRSVGWSDGALFGTRVRVHAASGRGSGGAFDEGRIGQPFYAEDTPIAWNFEWRHGSSIAHLYQSGAEVASFDARRASVDAWTGIGRRLGGVVQRAQIGFTWNNRDLGESRIGGVAPPEFDGPAEALRTRRVTLEGRLWRPRFVQRDGAERMDRIEDWDLGPQVGVQLGASPKFLGSTADEGWVRLDGSVGATNALGFGVLNARLSSRWRREPRELVRSAQGRWYVQWAGQHTIAMSLLAAEGTRVSRDYQLVVGGLNGLRAYPVQAIAGRELVRANVEHRWRPGWDVGGLARIGTAVFYDLAHGWGPGADPTNWFNAAGFGLRLVPPRAALGPIFRVDVAWPVSPTRDGQREAVFSFGSAQAF